MGGMNGQILVKNKLCDVLFVCVFHQPSSNCSRHTSYFCNSGKKPIAYLLEYAAVGRVGWEAGRGAGKHRNYIEKSK